MSDELNPLSEREMEIVRLLATGASNREIARELVISINTVKVHLRNIYAKLEVASRTEATMAAVRRGWVDVPRPTEDEVEDIAPDRMLPLERWPRVARAKRIALVAAASLALVVLFLPQLLQGLANGSATDDPLAGVFPTVSSPSSIPRWNTRAQLPTPRTNLAVVAHDNRVYAIGGISNEGVTGKVEVYDPQDDLWTTRSPKPTPVGFASAVVVDDRIYMPGGVGAEGGFVEVLEAYDPAQDTWEAYAPMPVPLVAYGLAAFEGWVYVFGGWDGQGSVNSVYRYDPAADQWETLRPMEQPRSFLGAAMLGERIYTVGGYDSGTELDTCEAYDPRTDTWTPCAPLIVPRGDLAVVASRNYLFALGGGMTSYLAFNERYDPRAEVWTRIETPVTEEWRGLGASFVSPQIYAIGGWSGANLSVNEAYTALYQIRLP